MKTGWTRKFNNSRSLLYLNSERNNMSDFYKQKNNLKNLVKVKYINSHINPYLDGKQ